MKTKIFLVTAVLTAFILLSCPTPDNNGNTDQTVKFTSLTQDGSPNLTTSKLILAFDKDIEGLSEDDITLDSDSTGAEKEYLIKKGAGAFELLVRNVVSNGEISVSVKKSGYNITGNPKKTDIFFKFGSITPDIPAGLIAKWYLNQNDANEDTKNAQYTITSDGKLLVLGQDNGLTVSASSHTITMFNNGSQAGTADYTLSGTALTISGASQGSVLINGTLYKKNHAISPNAVYLDTEVYNKIMALPGGTTKTNPVTLELAMELELFKPLPASFTGDEKTYRRSQLAIKQKQDWFFIMEEVNRAGKYVAIDLTNCSFSTQAFATYHDNVFFDFFYDESIGRQYVISLLFPDSLAYADVCGMHGGYNLSNPQNKELVFSHYTNLTSVNIPTSLTNMYDFYTDTKYNLIVQGGLFRLPSSLSQFNANGSNPAGFIPAENGKAILQHYGNKTYLAAYPTASGDIVLNNITDIGYRSFVYNNNITSVTSNSVTGVGVQAFYKCDYLSKIDLPACTIYNSEIVSNGQLHQLILPSVTNIKMGDILTYSQNYGPQLNITFGNVAPTIEFSPYTNWDYYNNHNFYIQVLIPQGATGYDTAWQNRFKDNQTKINLTMQYN